MTFVPLMLALLGCPADDADSADYGERGSCNPVDDALCALPYPSSFYLDEDSTTSTGYRVALADDSLPVNSSNDEYVATWNNEKDGWGIGNTLALYLGDLSDDGLIPHTDLDGYLADDATTIIYDVTDGARVPHWAERDMSAESDDERLLTLRPAVPLKYGHHYVVGVRGLTLADGSAAEAPTGFATLRDGTDTDDVDLLRQVSRYEDVIFPTLEAEGFARTDLLQAWELHTASRESMLGRMDLMLEESLAAADADGFTYEIDEVEDGDCEAGDTIGRTINGTFDAPLYMEADTPNTMLTRDDDGMPYQNGTTEVRFLVRIPCSVIEAGEPAPLLQYGHGLLGDLTEGKAGWLSNFANDFGYVVLATSWTGMATEDVLALATNITTDPGRMAVLPERVHQGLLEFALAPRFATTTLIDDESVSYDDVALIDPDNVVYYGNSQGGILGGAYMALAPDVKLGVLGVTGMPYSVLLHRSHDFDDWFELIKDSYADHRERSLIIFAMQHLWDAGEPIGWAWDLAEDTDKRVLLQNAYGDHQVPTLGGQLQARTYGASLIGDPWRDVWGLDTQASGYAGSALVEFHYTDADAEPNENLPPEGDADTHECPRREDAGQLQVDDFLRTGIVNDYCDGPCESLQSEVCN